MVLKASPLPEDKSSRMAFPTPTWLPAPHAMGRMPGVADNFHAWPGSSIPTSWKRLTNWGPGRGQIPTNQDTSAIMQPVAHSLNKAQIDAVAAYVSSLRSFSCLAISSVAHNVEPIA